MLVLACLSMRKDGERSYHHSGGLVNLVQACLSARKDRESKFHDCGGAVKFVQACLNPKCGPSTNPGLP